jgi:putative FmdB family regulatory protein
MPIYEYQCEACGESHEALQKVSDAPLEVCPRCQAPALRKKVSATAFRLKGGGWYETDFKTGDKKKNIAEDKGGDSKAAPKPAANGGSGD